MRRPPVPVAAAAGLLLGIVGNIATSTIHVSGPVPTTLVWTAAAGLFVSVLLLPNKEVEPHGALAAGREDAVHDLAALVTQQLKSRNRERRIPDPGPIQTHWHRADDVDTDHWANICRSADSERVDTPPIDLAGRYSHIADTYERIPSGRLVILGEPGAGKTTLADRLALDLLTRRRPGDPVPVVVDFHTWRTGQPLDSWLPRQIAVSVPGSSNNAVSAFLPALARNGQILMILDGFDELAPRFQADAIRHLNNFADLPLILTSRKLEFQLAIVEADVLTGAAIVEIDELTVDDLRAYLPLTESPNDAGERKGWPAVLKRLDGPDPAAARLRHALGTPLMVFLARVAYSDLKFRSPLQLLDERRFPDAADIEDRLLRDYLEAIYSPAAPHPSVWRAEAARRWLRNLAVHLDREKTRWEDSPSDDVHWARSARMDTVGDRARLGVGLDYGDFGIIAWWRLERMASRVAAATAWLVLTFVAASAIAYLRHLSFAPGSSGSFPRALLALEVALFSAAAFASIRSSPVPPPSYRPELARLGYGASLLLGTSLIGVFAWPTYRVAALPAAVAVSELGAAYVYMVVAKQSYGYSIIYGGHLEAVHESDLIDPVDYLSSPQRTLSHDRLVTLMRLAPFAAFPVIFWKANWFAGFVLAAFFIGSYAAATSWTRWLLVTRLWLPLTGRLPWRLLPFLDDARRTGVLRQIGSVYTFRHEKLRRHLADGHSGAATQRRAAHSAR